MNRIYPGSMILTITVLLTSCGVTEPREVRVVGRIDQSSAQPTVVVPNTVVSGTSFEVVITTTLVGCQRAGDTEVVVEGSTATVTPYDLDLIQRPGTICNTALVPTEHRATVTFASAGSALVVVRARDFGTDDEIELQFSVVVQ